MLKMTSVARAGFARGKRIRRKVRWSPAPSIRAASINSSGNASKNGDIRYTVNRRCRMAETERRPSPATSGHGRRRRRAFPRMGPATATSALAISGAPPGQRTDLDHPDHEHHQDEHHADRGGVAHVLVRERLV